MKERLKLLRKTLNLTQEQFSQKLGLKRQTVAAYEIGKIEPSDSTMLLLCREFNVNEKWLRTGEGEMFAPADRYEEIARLTRQLLDEEDDSFKNRFISMMANLTVDEWSWLENKLKELYNGMNKED